MAERRTPVVWVIWDGASYPVVRALLSQGELPFLEQVVQGGVLAPVEPPFPNCQTPPSLASLFTGVDPADHGVTGYRRPEVDREVTAWGSGFATGALRKSPIWEVVSAQERRVSLTHVPWVLDEAASGGAERPGVVFAVDGFARCLARPAVVPLDSRGSRSELVLGSAAITARVSADGSQAEVALGDRRWSLPFTPDLGAAPRRIRLGEGQVLNLCAWRRPADRRRCLVHGGLWRLRTLPRTALPAFTRQTRPFVGLSLRKHYRRGELGPRIMDGGTGEAEAAWLQSLHWLAEGFRSASIFALRQSLIGDLYVGYQPVIDEAQHELFRWLRLPVDGGRRSALECAVWQSIRDVYRAADEHLGSVSRMAGRRATVVVSSDHGFVKTERRLYVNEIFRRAGLLAFDVEGQIDLARTAATFHPARNGSVWINDVGRPGGIVSRAARHGVVCRALEALRDSRDPDTGAPLIEAVYPFDLADRGAWRESLGDLFVIPRPGYEPRAEASADRELTGETAKGGHHVTYGDTPSLRGIFAARGPGIAESRKLEEIRNRDVFAVLCRQLGCVPPADRTGQVPAGLLAARC